MKRTNSLLRDERAQDITEYALVLALVVLASAGLFLGAGGSVAGIWNGAGSQLAVANRTASDSSGHQGRGSDHGGSGWGHGGGDGGHHWF